MKPDEQLRYEIDKSEFESELEPFSLNEDTLDKAIEAANLVLQEAGANGLIELIQVAHIEPQSRIGCRCKRYETRCYSYKDCKKVGGKLVCTTKRKCERKCVAWECDT